MRYAQIVDDKVVNIILWDGEGRPPIKAGYLVLCEGVENAQIGGTRVNGEFLPRQLTAAEQAATQARQALLMAQEASRISARAKLKAGPKGLTDEELEALGL